MRSATLSSEGHGFSRAEKEVARSASSEGDRGNPFRVSPLSGSSLDGVWIEIFRAGDYGDRGTWTPEQLAHLAASYDPRLHAAPVVLGHPTHDAPAYGWVRRLRRAGHSLWAQLEKVDPAFEALLRAGRFRQRSVSLYKNFPLTRGPYLRHLGFLGAAPPAVKALAPVRPARRLVPSGVEGSLGEGGFAEAPCVSFSFDSGAADLQPAGPVPGPPAPQLHLSTAPTVGGNRESRVTSHESRPPEVPMPAAKSRLDAFLDHLRAFFAPSESRVGEGFSPSHPGSGDESRMRDSSPVPSVAEGPALAANAPAFSERLAALEQRLDALTARPRAVTPSERSGDPELVEGSDPESRSAGRGRVEGSAFSHIANFVESLRARGRFPPAFDRWGVSEFMQRLAAADATAPLGAEHVTGGHSFNRPEQEVAQSASFASAGQGSCPERSRRVSPDKNDAAPSATSEGDRGNPFRVSPNKTEPTPSLLTWFQDFLTRLPAVIEFGELASASDATRRSLGVGGPRTVRFTEPHRGLPIDPASVEMAERAEALAADLNIPYAEALSRLREEHRTTQTTA